MIETVDGLEMWATPDGFERYQVSTMGRFRRGMRQLNGSKNHNGYVHIGMIPSGSKKQDFRLAHRIVAQTFIPRPATDKYLVVNHKNGNRTDNRVSNLEWCTIQHNNTEWRHRK